MDAGRFDRVKVMGERASGTNFVSQLIDLNFAVRQLPNITSCTADQLEAILKMPEDKRHHFPISERTEDHNHLAELPENGGWKHAALTDRVFEVLPSAGQTFFLCILRHPAPWLLSLMRRPFHAFCNRADSAAEFLATPWMTRARDELDQLLLPGPGALWRLKAQSYIQQAGRRPNVTVLRHEDLLRNPASVLDGIPLPRKSAGPWEIPGENARSWQSAQDIPEADAPGFHALRAALPDDPWDLLEPDDAAALAAQIGTQTLERAGYVPPGEAQ